MREQRIEDNFDFDWPFYLFYHNKAFKAIALLRPMPLAHLYGIFFKTFSLRDDVNKKFNGLDRYQRLTPDKLRRNIIFIHGENGNHSIPFSNRESLARNLSERAATNCWACYLLPMVQERQRVSGILKNSFSQLPSAFAKNLLEQKL